MALWPPASVVSGKASQALLSQRERLSPPKVRATIQRHGSPRQPGGCRGRFTLARGRRSPVAPHATNVPAAPPSAQLSGSPGPRATNAVPTSLAPSRLLAPCRRHQHDGEPPADIDHACGARRPRLRWPPLIASAPPWAGGFTVWRSRRPARGSRALPQAARRSPRRGQASVPSRLPGARADPQRRRATGVARLGGACAMGSRPAGP